MKREEGSSAGCIIQSVMPTDEEGPKKTAEAKAEAKATAKAEAKIAAAKAAAEKDEEAGESSSSSSSESDVTEYEDGIYFSGSGVPRKKVKGTETKVFMEKVEDEKVGLRAKLDAYDLAGLLDETLQARAGSLKPQLCENTLRNCQRGITLNVRKMAEDSHERIGELTASLVTTDEEVSSGTEVAAVLQSEFHQSEKRKEEALKKVELHFENEQAKLMEKQKDVTKQVANLRAGRECINEALASTRALKQCMTSCYVMLQQAARLGGNQTARLFDDSDARSVPSQKSGKERALEAAVAKKIKEVEKQKLDEKRSRKAEEREAPATQQAKKNAKTPQHQKKEEKKRKGSIKHDVEEKETSPQEIMTKIREKPRLQEQDAVSANQTCHYCHRRGHLASQREEMHAEVASLNAALPEEAKALGFPLLIFSRKDLHLGASPSRRGYRRR